MDNNVYTDYSQLPLTLSAPQVATVLGISSSKAYELFRRKDFPVIILGRRKIVSKEKLMKWMESKAN